MDVQSSAVLPVIGQPEDQTSVEAISDLASRYRSGEQLSEADIDVIADTAITVLRDLLGYFDASDVSIDEYESDEGELILDIGASNLAVLIGRHGRTLDSLQTMLSLLVSRKFGFRYPISVDIEGYKSRRRHKLIDMANSAAMRVVAQNSSLSLPPMNPYERRIVHICLREHAGIETHSEGLEPDRHVVISPV
ncbi:single-stranded nucleic acid binding R3H domain-containing protein [Coriobacterium glomerans PW2]|uniref:Single-stranded nucleic acid binding R3H domain-containing protein n=1 Tax=Coriobacterium glomerans (strain ATCC 49209 / DSM 20642 / JCM 10262 / PW2) TaxID=700015 RepID=F2N9E7_CORGP|nr:R3H domain-containing nucleic acid-binding protein [Coriobacterium glomerans]AEB07895.1 single-stranded nucleic acid binding R3H domain-containing protein [Coriobacterium glomerans PW2]